MIEATEQAAKAEPPIFIQEKYRSEQRFDSIIAVYFAQLLYIVLCNPWLNMQPMQFIFHYQSLVNLFVFSILTTVIIGIYTVVAIKTDRNHSFYYTRIWQSYTRIWYDVVMIYPWRFWIIHCWMTILTQN